ncbi:MAG: hypothetical protein PHH83_04075 [Patescibacteria group bacterium]|nr:hypothetical protein [Patescibacteria group bacterium]
MKKNAIFICSGFILAVVLSLVFGFIHIPHEVLVNVYFWGHNNWWPVQRLVIRQMVKQADTVQDLSIISVYTRWISLETGDQIHPKEQIAILKKMLKIATRNPECPYFERFSGPAYEQSAMQLALRWGLEILTTRNPKDHQKIKNMIAKYYKQYRVAYTPNDEEKLFAKEIAEKKFGEL